MSDLALYTQDPQEKLDYTQDWSDELGADTIASDTWAIAPTGPTMSGETNPSTQSGTIFVQGLTAGTFYTLTHQVTTTAGRIFERTISIWAESK